MMQLPGNPYALILDGVCTEVIAMQDYDDAQIQKTLEGHEYDYVICCSEVGYEIFCGQTLQQGVWAYPSIYPSWKLNTLTRGWEPPVPHPSDGKDYHWSEEDLAWVSCAECNENIETVDLVTYGRVKDNS